MSDVNTWVVLGDGRYLRIFFNNGPGLDLWTLRQDDLEALAKLNYEIITRKSPDGKGDAGGHRDYCKLVADFLKEQHEQGLYNRLVIGAPEPVLKGLREAMPDEVKALVVGEHEGDLLSRPLHVIEKLLGEMVTAGQ